MKKKKGEGLAGECGLHPSTSYIALRESQPRKKLYPEKEKRTTFDKIRFQHVTIKHRRRGDVAVSHMGWRETIDSKANRQASP